MARKRKGEDINGWLIIDKPKDMTSNKIVGITRRVFNAKKNGHTGTLDPFATGLLPIAFGEATKLVSIVMDADKEYEFVIQWGKSTNTDDCDGEIVKTCEKVPTKDEILKIIPEFIGIIMQKPTAFSAIKIDGERAYNLARAGVEVDMPLRKVEILELELLEELPENRARFRVLCSKGTYVRTLGKDMAEKLGSLGYLEELRRTKTGVFSLEDKILLENVENMVYKEELEKVLLPINASLRDIAVLAVSEADAAKLKQGQSVSPKNYDICSLIGKPAVAMFEDNLVAIIEVDERKISTTRVFNL